MVTRREFIQWMLALGVSSSGLAALLEVTGCAPSQPPGPPTPTPPAPVIRAASPTSARPDDTATPIPPTPTAPSGAPPPAATATAAPAYLAVARGDDPAELTRRAVQALGGIEQFVKPGQKVIIKPNICVAYHGPEYAVTTNPQVVAALVTGPRAGAASSDY